MNLVIISSFLLKNDYIATNLCENKNKPELKCHGNCYIKKQFEKEEKKESEKNMDLKSQIEWAFTSDIHKKHTLYLVEINEIETLYLRTFSIDFNNSIFRPPPSC